MENVIKEVRKERERQNKKWGIQDHNAVEWIAILTEEVGEASKEAVDFHFNNSVMDMEGQPACEIVQDIAQKERIKNYRKECIQIAAVAVQMVESLDRQTKNAFI